MAYKYVVKGQNRNMKKLLHFYHKYDRLVIQEVDAFHLFIFCLYKMEGSAFPRCSKGSAL